MPAAPHPASVARELRRADLRPGDVLLMRGFPDSAIVGWILLLDGGSFSHAALWDGDCVLEASGDSGGIRETDLDDALATHERIAVYRFTRNGRFLGDPEWSAGPILDVARSLVGAGYPYAELGLLGVLVGLGRTAGVPQAEQFFRGMGGQLSALIAWLKQDASRKKPMTCSQFVSFAFWEADPTPERRYSLTIPYIPRPGMARGLEPALVAECRRELLGDFSPPEFPGGRHLTRGHHGERAFGVETREVRAGSKALPNNCVTPKDLERSPALHCLGSLL